MELTDVVGVFCAAEERLKDPILQMLSRKRDAGFCIAIVKTVFTRTAEGLPIAAFNARLESCISYIRSSEECRLPGWCFGNGEEDVSVYAKRAFDMLAKPIATGGYGWLRCERAEETLKETVFISMNGLSALDMYDRLGMEAKAFTGVKAEDFAYQMNDLTTLLTMDRRSRIRQLEERIAPYQHQIEILRAGGDMDTDGLEILARYRQAGLPCESILMTLDDFKRYEEYGTRYSKDNGQVFVRCEDEALAAFLTDAERGLYLALCGDSLKKNRIEQEKIPFQDALNYLNRRKTLVSATGSVNCV